MLRLYDVHTYYGESYILQGVSMEVKEGFAVALLGRNGMGKTTTIRSIIGFAPPRQGVIDFKGEDITKVQHYQIARKGIGLVPQGRRIFSSLSVEENLTMAARGGEKKGAWNLERIYSLYPILEKRAKNKGNLLSGGEQQMLTIARALMTNPHLLLMDEPSEGLAPIIVKEVGHIVQKLKESGFSIFLVEQNLEMALAVADYAYILSKGKIVHESTARELRENEEAISRFIGVGGM